MISKFKTGNTVLCSRSRLGIIFLFHVFDMSNTIIPNTTDLQSHELFVVPSANVSFSGLYQRLIASTQMSINSDKFIQFVKFHLRIWWKKIEENNKQTNADELPII